MNHAPFEDFYNLFNEKIESKEWIRFIDGLKKSNSIYFIGNGGNMAVASHAAADITRLTDKKAWSLDSQSLLTSIANDYGYENIFLRWLENYSIPTDNNIVVGFSGSGNSKNVISALHWANEQHNWKTVLISGSKSTCLDENILEINFNNDYFHTHEILSIMCFYEIVYNLDCQCPTIKAELVRKYGKS